MDRHDDRRRSPRRNRRLGIMKSLRPSSLSRSARLLIIIFISSAFFVVEIAVGFRNHSLALVADAFHVSNDLIGFVIAYLAVRKARQPAPSVGTPETSPERQRKTGSTTKGLSFGWQRAELTGAFFNGVFLLALGVSIILQTIERFIRPEAISDPDLVIIVGSIGFGLNLLSALVVHEHGHGHEHSPQSSEADAYALDGRVGRPSQDRHAGHAHAIRPDGRKSRRRMDLGILSVFLHLLSDAFNNLLVIISAVVFLVTSKPSPTGGEREGGFIYADPIASLLVGLMILLSSLPLVKRTGKIMLEGVPGDVDIHGVASDVLRVQNVEDVHEVHAWSLTQSKALATMHVVVSDDSLSSFMKTAQQISECLHQWNLHNVVIQPELASAPPYPSAEQRSSPSSATEAPAIVSQSNASAGAAGEVAAETTTCRLRCAGAKGACENEPCCE